jgi:AcrR family transcriptional regulator
MTPPPPPPPSARAKAAPADKREAILDAALELFVERGFHGTAVPEIAERAGVGAGTIYRHFASKEAIVNAMYQQYKGELTGSILRDFPVDKPARAQVGHLWQRLAAYAAAKPKAYAFLELHHHASYLDAESVAIEKRIVDLGMHLLAQAQARGEVKQAPPMLLAALVQGAFIGMVRAAWEGKLTLTPEIITQAEQAAWEMIRA